ncbi:F-box protein At3g56470-like [Gastrolobium bilobum]|uniref:F-box protein At3g56470-like n=1 Tax=Gastrolobium bilobum TaxID=150636 RepID=UPI002AB084D4|nr:F-box protein At3g56470-like [Gastrolobium bilobum]
MRPLFSQKVPGSMVSGDTDLQDLGNTEGSSSRGGKKNVKKGKKVSASVLGRKKVKKMQMMQNKMQKVQWSNLPEDLLIRIADGLGLIDFLCFRGVCKDWHNASSKAKHKCSGADPWFLLYDDGEGSQCSLLSNQDKIYTINIPELDGATCLASNEGWLLVFRHGSMFFFCPFSRAKIELPSCPFTELSDHIAAFSSVPTSQDCTLVVISRSNDYELELYLLCRGNSIWAKHNFSCNGFSLHTITFAAFGQGKFHFFDRFDGLVTFDANTQVWRTRAIVQCWYKFTVGELRYEMQRNMLKYMDVKSKLGLEANVSISTCGTLMTGSSGEYGFAIQGENIHGYTKYFLLGSRGAITFVNTKTEIRHVKGVWIQPSYLNIPPDQSW